MSARLFSNAVLQLLVGLALGAVLTWWIMSTAVPELTIDVQNREVRIK